MHYRNLVLCPHYPLLEKNSSIAMKRRDRLKYPRQTSCGTRGKKYAHTQQVSMEHSEL